MDKISKKDASRSMHIEIKGDKWEVLLFDGDEFNKKCEKYFGKVVDAFMRPNDRQIIFNEDDVNLIIVIHELTHAYFDYLHLSSTENIKLDDFEEIFCEMMANDGDKIIKQSRALLHKIRRA